MSNEFYPLLVADKVNEGSKAVSIVFEIPEDLNTVFEYKSGQYLTLKANINGESIRRAYSLSSYPGDGNKLQVSSKVVEQGKMSNFLFHDLKIGDKLEVMSPMGNFTLPSQVKSLVLLAAGSGITPLISILKSALTSGVEKVFMIYSNRTKEETMFLEELKSLDSMHDHFQIQCLWSSEGNRIDKAVIEKLIQDNDLIQKQSDFFICGPTGMIEAAESSLKELSVNKEKIHIEYFASPKTDDDKSEAPVPEGELNEVTLIMDDESHKVSLLKNETILEAAERIAIDPPFSCQSGVCTTCMAKIMQGEVHMENNFGLGQDEIEEGYVLTCISTPTTPGVVISWDE